MNETKVKISIGSSLIALALAVASPVAAQTASTPSPADTPRSSEPAADASALPADGAVQESSEPSDAAIIVTGSYIAGPRAQRATLDVVSSEDIAKSIKPNLAQLLAELPSSISNLVTGGSTQTINSPAAAINLRGLGPRATLVLLNGQRQVPISEPGGQDSFQVDINSLVPSVLVGRVEVLKDGASALYGSDAVAGVVNFITRKDLDGLVVDGNLNALDTRGDRGTPFSYRASIGLGWHNDTTSAIIGAEYSHQAGVYVDQIFDEARRRRFGQLSPFGNPSTYFIGTGAARRTIPDPLCASPSIGGPGIAGVLVGNVCNADNTFNRGMVAEIDHYLGYANIKHEVNDWLNVTLELGGSAIRLHRGNGQGFPASARSFTLPTTNPNNPFGAPATFQYRGGANFANELSFTNTSSDLYRARLTFDGQINDNWSFEVGAAYGLDRTFADTSGYFSSSRLQAALNCQGGASGNLCFNPFAASYSAAPGTVAYNSPDVLNYVRVDYTNNSRYTLATLDARITGTLFNLWNGNPVKTAFGVQRRMESTRGIFDPFTQVGDLATGAGQQNYDVSRDVNAAFAELLFPLTDTIEVSAAGRYEASSPGSASFNPKLGVSWKIFPELTLSGTIGRSERAPGLLQLIGTSTTQNIARDPITGAAQPAVPVRFLATTGLDAESSTNWNIGANWSQPTGFGSLQLRLDYWNIDFKNLITSPDIVSLVTNDPRNPAIVRDPVTNLIRVITVPGFFNANSEKIAGLDFNALVRVDTGASSSVFASIDGTYMTHYDLTANGVTQKLIGVYTTIPRGSNIPRLAGRVSIGFNSKAFDLTFTAVHKSKFREVQAALIGITEEKSYTTFDMSSQFRFNDSFSVTAGIVNIFNHLPPAQPGTLYTVNDLAYPSTGRAFNLGFRASF